MHSIYTKERPKSYRLNHDSPLTAPNAKTEVNLGEYIVLKNTSGRNLALGDVQVGQGEDWWQFSASDTIEPNAYALICYGISADQTEFLSVNNLPTALTSDASVQWHWQSTVTFADVEGQTAIRLYENGKPGTTLDQLYWNSEGLQAINAHCDASCQADPNREVVNSLQLDDFSYDPVNPWDESKWTTAEATAKGKGTSQPEAPTAVRGLLKKEYELKDHLGNVHVVVTDRKHSTISAGPSIGEFKADVVVMRDYYPFGMEMEGQGYAAGEYRYGFNGQETDDEIKGNGNNIYYIARTYDPRLGKFLSIDPLTAKYPMLTPFQFASNTPIWGVDLDGEEVRIYTESGNYLKLNVGHTFISIGSADDLVVYTYGRYDDLAKNKGSLNATNFKGEGVLIRLTGEKAEKFISKYVNVHDAEAYELTDVDEVGEQNVREFFEFKFSSTDELPSNPKKTFYNDPDSRVIDQYKLFKNNCTTLSHQGAQESGTAANFKIETEGGFNPAGPTGSYRIKRKAISPRELEKYLEKESRKSGSSIKKVTGEIKD